MFLVFCSERQCSGRDWTSLLWTFFFSVSLGLVRMLFGSDISLYLICRYIHIWIYSCHVLWSDIAIFSPRFLLLLHCLPLRIIHSYFYFIRDKIFMRKIHVLLYLNVKIRKGQDSWSVLPAVTGLLSFTVYIGKALAIYIYYLHWMLLLSSLWFKLLEQ